MSNKIEELETKIALLEGEVEKFQNPSGSVVASGENVDDDPTITSGSEPKPVVPSKSSAAAAKNKASVKPTATKTSASPKAPPQQVGHFYLFYKWWSLSTLLESYFQRPLCYRLVNQVLPQPPSGQPGLSSLLPSSRW